LPLLPATTLDGSDDGVPRGTPTSEGVALSADGAYEFDVEPASVVILTLPGAPPSTLPLHREDA
jgi:hypothetical protein